MNDESGGREQQSIRAQFYEQPTVFTNIDDVHEAYLGGEIDEDEMEEHLRRVLEYNDEF